MIFIGLVGPIAAGKGITADFLTKKYGFQSLSLSKIVHDEVENRKIQHFTRKTLQDIGDELRKKFGNDVLAKRTVEKATEKSLKKVIIEGIRNPAEVVYLKALPQFILIAVKANRLTRFHRLKDREKPWDPVHWKDFLAVDRRDSGVGQIESGQQVGACIKMADYNLNNNKDIKTFQRKVDKLMKKIINQKF